MILTKELSEEILINILVNLPMKMVIRSRCVCKTWRDLIRNPYFIEKISKIKKNEKAMVFANCRLYCDQHEYRLMTDTPPFSSLVDLKLPKDLNLAGSCNGIVCLAPRSPGWKTVVLCNPITRQHYTISSSLLGDADYKSRNNFQILGFGLDKSSNDYKVLRICFNELKTNRYAEIYSLKRNSWRKLEFESMPLLNNIQSNQRPIGVFLNGSVHWVIDPYFKIYTFDFETEKFGEFIKLVEIASPNLDFECKCLTTVDDSLAVVSRNGYDIQVWVMMEYGKRESWTKKFSVLDFLIQDWMWQDTYWVNDMKQLVAINTSGKLIIFHENDDSGSIIFEFYPNNPLVKGGVVFQPSLTFLPSIS